MLTVNIKGILFDLDGVLVKSMEQHLAAWQYAFRNFNIEIKAKDFYQLEGRGVKSVVADLTARYGLDPDLGPQIARTKISRYKEIFKAEFYEGLFPLLDFLKENKIKMAVVTGGDRNRVQQLLEKYLKGYFDGLVSADDVRNTKPYPEPYLRGAELIGLRPEECLVIENAPLGIRAAKQAGTFVIGVQTTVGAAVLHEADIVLTDIEAVRKYLVNLFSDSEQPGLTKTG